MVNRQSRFLQTFGLGIAEKSGTSCRACFVITFAGGECLESDHPPRLQILEVRRWSGLG